MTPTGPELPPPAEGSDETTANDAAVVARGASGELDVVGSLAEPAGVENLEWEAPKAGPQAREEVAALRLALGALVAAVEQAGWGRRYWPRDMRLDGTAELVGRALDAALEVLASDEVRAALPSDQDKE